MSKPICEEIKDLPSEDGLRGWIEAQASHHNLKYLLAHADDGVIWGRFENGKLVTADEVSDKKFKQLPKLRLATLLQCRIFGEAGEVSLWKSNDRIKARSLTELATNKLQLSPIAEHQLLWGTHRVHQERGFTLLKDGSQGLKHAVPVVEGLQFDQEEKLSNSLRLVVHHYIEIDDDGLARISISRLADLRIIQ